MDEKRKIGSSLKVTPVGLGCMGFSHASGDPVPEADAVKALREAYELGYDFFDTADNVNQYISDYSTENNEVCFIEYSYENNAVYGIIISNEHVKFSESKLMYDILGLDKDSYGLVYTQQTSSYGYSSSSSDHYHTVVPDRYSLSRSDPGAYYDHYEYGDNYEIDDYLESEGYD